MTALDIVNLLSSFGSLLISIVAIVFSIMFYRWTNKSNAELQSATIKIESNTNKLEKIFDKLYSDTFGIMKSNIEVMQQHIFASNSTGDSSLNQIEQTEELILSFLAKTKESNTNTLKYIVKNNTKNLSSADHQIEEAISNLIQNGKIRQEGDLIYLDLKSVSKSDEAE